MVLESEADQGELRRKAEVGRWQSAAEDKDRLCPSTRAFRLLKSGGKSKEEGIIYLVSQVVLSGL